MTGEIRLRNCGASKRTSFCKELRDLERPMRSRNWLCGYATDYKASTENQSLRSTKNWKKRAVLSLRHFTNRWIMRILSRG